MYIARITISIDTPNNIEPSIMIPWTFILAKATNLGFGWSLICAGSEKAKRPCSGPGKVCCLIVFNYSFGSKETKAAEAHGRQTDGRTVVSKGWNPPKISSSQDVIRKDRRKLCKLNKSLFESSKSILKNMKKKIVFLKEPLYLTNQ